MFDKFARNFFLYLLDICLVTSFYMFRFFAIYVDPYPAGSESDQPLVPCSIEACQCIESGGHIIEKDKS